MAISPLIPGPSGADGGAARSAVDFEAEGAAPPSARGSVSAWWKSLRATAHPLNLALQGGGAHGAFTWGVLETLLDDPRLAFEGLSGSSAGAMNAVVVADGWAKGGRDGARRALADFWSAVGKQMPAGMVTNGDDESIGLAPAARLLAAWAGYFSPSQLNPFDLNPLRDLLLAQVDFERLRVSSPFKLFIGATQVHTGRLRVFREHELTVDVLLASACLPKVHRAVEIDGQFYWDGGYSANPAVFPLFYDCRSPDVLLVLLSPLQRQVTPQTVGEIETRIVELAFSAHFLREMQMLTRAARYAQPTFLTLGRLERRLQKMRFHMIDSGGLATLARTDTQLLAYAPFLELLRAQGRERASAWLLAHGGSVGHRASVDISRWFA